MTAPPRLLDLDLRIRTERLVLSPVVADDLEALWPWVSDPEFPRYLSWEAHQTFADTAAFLAAAAAATARDAGVTWGVRDRTGLLGVVSIEGIVRRARAWQLDLGTFGAWLGTEHWGKGIITEAGRAVLEFAFSKMRLHKLVSGHVAEAAASRRLVERLGFREIGVQRDHFERYGRWWDHVLWELTEGDWRAANAPGSSPTGPPC